MKENINTLFMGFTKSEAVKLFANTYEGELCCFRLQISVNVKELVFVR